MGRTVSLHGSDWTILGDRPGYARRERLLREALGASRIGATVYELEPGCRMFPYHYHHAEEEWLLVVAGEPTVRMPDGERRLAPWDVLAFPRGEAGAHEVRNEGETTAHVLMLSTLADVEVCVYPDSGKIGARAAPGARLMNRPEANLDYFDGEP